MAITFVNSATVNAAAATSITVDKPTDTGSGDRIYFIVTTNGDSAPSITDNNGSTPTSKKGTFISTNPSGAIQIDIFWRDCQGSEPTTYTFNKSTSERGSVVAATFRGCSASPFETDPALGNSYPNPSGTSLTSPGVTTLSDNTLVMCALGTDGGSFIPSAISDMTLICACAGHENTGLGYAIQTSEGASGDKTWTVNAGQYVTTTVWSVATAPTPPLGAFDADLVKTEWFDPTNKALGWFNWGLPFSHDLVADTAAAFVLTLLSGSYAVTGSNVTLEADRKLTLNAGSYAITGSNVGLNKGFALTLLSGSYSVTGTDLTLRAARFLTLGSGSYTLTGSNVALSKGIVLTLLGGSYVVTGSNVDLQADRFLTLGSGSYSVTGAALTLNKGVTLTLLSGSYAVTGTNLTLLAARLLTLGAGSYSVTGTNLALLVGRLLSLGAGSYTITGTNAQLLATRLLSLGSGSYTVAGTDITLTVGVAGGPEGIPLTVHHLSVRLPGSQAAEIDLEVHNTELITVRTSVRYI